MATNIDSDVLAPDALRRRWLELAPVMPEDGRPEIDEYGELILSPLPTNHHQRIASFVGHQLATALGGEAIGSLAILTRIGVRVPDMTWTADAGPFAADPAPTAPEICIEVASPGNSTKWLREKTGAYLAAGAREVIIVELDGRIRYFTDVGEQPTSSFGVTLSLPLP